jgi:hypothetical protein
MKAVTTFVMGAIGLAGVAVGLPLGLFASGPIVIAGCH